MLRFYTLWMCVGLLLLGTVAAAWAEPVAVPPFERYVTDLTNTLTPLQQQGLESKLAEFTREHGSQIAILLVSTTQPEDIAQYSARVFAEWKLGRAKIDDGVLITLAVQDKKSRIEVGYGLEGALNDATANRIRTEVMRPLIRAGDIAGGLEAGIESIIKVIQGEALPPPSRSSSSHFGIAFGELFILAIVVGAISASVFGQPVGPLLSGGGIGALSGFSLGLLPGVLFGLGTALFSSVIASGGGARRAGSFYQDPYSRGWGGFHTSGGGWSGGDNGSGFSGGGGGDFGGGGASGDW